MGENRSSTGRRSEVELSTLPEVAALATELTLIFKSLGMSQQQYAIRTNYDKSYVSRFLNGRRVATQDFIDRLLKEVEGSRGLPIKEETRDRLSQLRRAALQVYDPELYKLEKIRDEAERYHREVKRLMLHQEALEGLLERRQAEFSEARIELARAQSDWIADRVQTEAEILSLKGQRLRHEEERKALLEEISRLRQELKATIEQRDIAEQRCALLEEKAQTVEFDVAEKREREDIDDIGVPVQFVQDRLKHADDMSAYRELVEFATSRTSSDVAEMAFWLHRESMNEYAVQVVRDYCRQRAIAFSVDLVRVAEKELGTRVNDAAYVHLTSSVAEAVSLRPLDEMLAFIELYFDAHGPGKFAPKGVAVMAVCSGWLRHRNQKGREKDFFIILDKLNSLGEKDLGDAFIRRQIGYSGGVGRIGRIIAESGREADIRVYVDAWLNSVKEPDPAGPFQIARHFRTVAEFTNPLMFNMMLDAVWSSYDLADLSGIYLYTSSGNTNTAFDRFTKYIKERGMIESMKTAVYEHHHATLQIDDPS